MKYIRTKGGIFRTSGATEAHIYGEWRSISKIKVIKEADTIWELCDGFYIDVCGPIFEKQFIYSKEEYYDFHYMITQCLNESNIKYKAYGFIKTDKGLIYVSELKDKDMVLL